MRNIYRIQDVHHATRLNLSSERGKGCRQVFDSTNCIKASAISLLILVPERDPTGTRLISAVIIL